MSFRKQFWLRGITTTVLLCFFPGAREEMEQKGSSPAEDTVCSSPQQGPQPLGASDLAPMESLRSPVAGRPLGVEGELSSGKLWGLPGQQL